MKRQIAIAILLMFCAEGMAQVNVHLRGVGDNVAGKTVELYCYDDMLTMSEQLLDHTAADSTGAFELGCYLTYPRLVFVQIDNYSQSFYAEPGRTYEVYLPTFRWEQDEERNVYLDPVALPLQFLNIPPDELNLKVLRFDVAVDSFLSENRVFFDPKFKPNRLWMDSLERAMQPMLSEHSTTEGDFFGRYVQYTLAEMRYAMRFASRKVMFERYVMDKPVLYHDENYMRFVLELMDGMISMGTAKLPKWKLVEWVDAEALDRYLDSIGTDPLLHDEQLRELATLVALKESYYDADYPRSGVRHMVQQIGSRSKFEEHRHIAERLERGFMRAEEGEEVANSFVLPDAEGNMIHLDTMLGRWIYISFVRVGNPECLRELETMAFFRDSVYAQGNVAFVSISCDRDPQKMRSFLQESRCGKRCLWTWLHFDGDYHLLEHYGIVDYPAFLLINPEGRLHYSNTPPPASGIFLNAPWKKPTEAPTPILPFIKQD